MRSIEKNCSVKEERRGILREKGERYQHTVLEVVRSCDYLKPESALAIAGDDAYQEALKTKIARLVGASHVILVGIGGSSLGTEALYHMLKADNSPKLLTIDTINSDTSAGLSEFLKDVRTKEEIALVVISKSGTTTETLVNAVLVLEHCNRRFGDQVYDRAVFVGADGSDFLKAANEKGIHCVSFPESISGRFSIMSAVGTIPLLLLGINVGEFHRGARVALEEETTRETIEHAVTLALLAEAGVHTVNFFAFDERLRVVGFWYRQLLAESIGKKMVTEGATFSLQLLPTVATSVDLHSMAQLYLGGYRGLFTHFVYAEGSGETEQLPDHWLLDHTEVLKGKSPRDIMNAIREGVLRSYDDEVLPYRLTVLPGMTAYEAGHLMSSLMLEVMLLGHLFNVDTFDQPNVESYKEHTRTILAT